MAKDEIKFEIVQSIATLSTNKSGWSKELNIVSWNGRAPVYDLRSWDPNHEKMGKGLTMTKEELKELAAIIEDEIK